MKKALFLAGMISGLTTIKAQQFISLSKEDCIKTAWKIIGETAMTSKTLAYDKALSPPDTMSIAGFTGTAAPLRLHLKFDSSKQCNLEIWYFNSQSDLNTYLQQVLGDPKWGWKKLNENQYISDFAHQRTLEVPPENSAWQFSVIRSAWTRALYELLTQ
jgi:hypothetical protein